MPFKNLSASIILLRLALVVSVVMLAAAWFLPMITLTKFYLFDNTFSVMGGLQQLWFEGQWLLFIVIGLFSVALPLIKLFFLFLLSFGDSEISPQRKKYLKLMHDYGRWAMLDVMVVAILIVTVKLGAIASVEVHWGLYLFAAAVLLIMLLTQLTVKSFEHE